MQLEGSHVSADPPLLDSDCPEGGHLEHRARFAGYMAVTCDIAKEVAGDAWANQDHSRQSRARDENEDLRGHKCIPGRGPGRGGILQGCQPRLSQLVLRLLFIS